MSGFPGKQHPFLLSIKVAECVPGKVRPALTSKSWGRASVINTNASSNACFILLHKICKIYWEKPVDIEKSDGLKE